MGPPALLPLRRKACWGFFALKNPTASAGFEPANLGTRGQHASSRPPKTLWQIGIDISWKPTAFVFSVEVLSLIFITFLLASFAVKSYLKRSAICFGQNLKDCGLIGYIGLPKSDCSNYLQQFITLVQISCFISEKQKFGLY
jgi:hypothetical protein